VKIFLSVLVIVLVGYAVHLATNVDTGVYVSSNYWTVECTVEMETKTVCDKEESNFVPPRNTSEAFASVGSFWSLANPNSPLNPLSPNKGLLNFGTGSRCEESTVTECAEYRLVKKVSK
jgi:hypothetical protein